MEQSAEGRSASRTDSRALALIYLDGSDAQRLLLAESDGRARFLRKR